MNKNLWIKCPKTGIIVYKKYLINNWMVHPKSGYHFQLNSDRRIKLLLDEGSFTEFDKNLLSIDPLNFKGKISYKKKIIISKKKTKLNEAVISGIGKINKMTISIAVMDFRFLGASMGAVVGEKITRSIERAQKKKIPLLIIASSGGARMYEGVISLMQMVKTSSALKDLSDKKIPYIAVLTNPTMAGVMASFASLGDIILAEPDALIGFAGPRVIRETTQQSKFPKNFQKSKFLFKNGLIDQIVHRSNLKSTISFFLKALFYN